VLCIHEPWLLLLSAGLASAYVLDVWLHGSICARARGYLEVRWPSGPFLCRLCLALYVAATFTAWSVWMAGTFWRFPVDALAVAWLACRLGSVHGGPDEQPLNEQYISPGQ
jgi:hypothetical protein